MSRNIPILLSHIQPFFFLFNRLSSKKRGFLFSIGSTTLFSGRLLDSLRLRFGRTGGRTTILPSTWARQNEDGHMEQKI
uniref:Uncharacterized protein n=1 Tax=Schistosoma curassoni TaxID=6186 RepID=A0A183KBB1_9TREM